MERWQSGLMRRTRNAVYRASSIVGPNPTLSAKLILAKMCEQKEPIVQLTGGYQSGSGLYQTVSVSRF